ncbi:LOW QUALITY PROTEIN: CFL1 Probable ferric reductase transmembrane component [Candida maltosa Xu316]
MKLILLFTLVISTTTLAMQPLPDYIGKTYQSYGHSRSVYACRMHIHKTVKACSTTSIQEYGCMCTNKDAINTFIQCYAYFQKNSTEAIQFFVNYCENFGNVTTNIDQISDAYEDYVNTGSYTVIPSVVSPVNATNMTVPINQTEYSEYAYGLEASIDQFLTNWERSFFYGMAMTSYWGFALLIGAVSNWTQYLFPGLMTDLTGPVSNWWRKNITMPAAFGSRKAQEYTFFVRFLQGYMPTRLESIITSGFCLVVIIVLSINTYYSVGNEIIFTNYVAQLRYLANRTGINSTILMPFLILFAGRNNILQWITRWNYGVFMTFHRFIGRIMFLFVVLHAVTFSIALGVDYYPLMTLPFMIWGTVSTVAGAIIMVQATLFLRRKWYEVFLVIHIVMALLFVIGGWVHINYLGYEWWVFTAIGLWGIDRIIRVCRIIAFGFPEADITIVSDETLKIKIPRPSYWKPVAGGHIFIHFFRPDCFWESHPFTFAPSVEDENTIVLYTKVKQGVTRKLYNYLVHCPGRNAKITVGVEGPYGECCAAGKSQTAVFIAGGNGVPGMFSEVYHLAQNMGKDSGKRIKLLWTIREYRSLNWMYEELDRLKDYDVEVSVYITKPDSDAFLSELSTRIISSKYSNIPDEFDAITTSSIYEKHSFSDKSTIVITNISTSFNPESIKEAIRAQLYNVNFKHGRPNIKQIIEEETEQAQGSIAFVSCGHPAMVDDIRAEVIDAVGKHNKRIDFYDQLIGWA